MNHVHRHVVLDRLLGEEMVIEIRGKGIVRGKLSYFAGYYKLTDGEKEVSFRKSHMGGDIRYFGEHMCLASEYKEGMWDVKKERKTSPERLEKARQYRERKKAERLAEMKRRGII